MNQLELTTSLEEAKQQLEYTLNSLHSEISDATIEKNLIFLELLDTFDGSSFRGIPGFLEKKGYETKAMKYKVNGGSVKLTPGQADLVVSGKWRIGLKNFYNLDVDGKVSEIYGYIVLAKKKDTMGIDKIKKGVKNFMNDLVGSKATQ